jgi:multidrug efflux pump subunit AcrB
MAPGRERGFGFWWLVATVAVAIVLGMVVALLLTPVAGLIALLVVAIWALVHRHRRKQRLGTPGGIATEAPVAA